MDNESSIARTENQFAPYSVSQAAQIYTESLRTNLSKIEMIVSGFYKDSRRRDYNGIYYDYLLDIDNRSSLTIKLPERIKNDLTDGECYELSGFFNLSRKDSSLQLNFNITSVIGRNKETELVSEDDFNLIRARYDRGLVDIYIIIKNGIRENGNVNFAILTGETSIVDNDFSKAVGSDGDNHYYSVDFIRTNLSSPAGILNSIQKLDLDEYDFLVFMRGGGTGIEVFDNKELCKAILDLDKPFVTAIGHEVDTPLLDKLSDLRFSTPTLFGSFLKGIREEVIAERVTLFNQEMMNRQFTTEMKQLTLSYEQKLQESDATSKRLYAQLYSDHVKQRKIAIYIIAALVIILLLILFFK